MGFNMLSERTLEVSGRAFVDIDGYYQWESGADGTQL